MKSYSNSRLHQLRPSCTGLLVSVDPHQVGKAIRELKLLLEPYVARLLLDVHYSENHVPSEENNQKSLSSQLELELDNLRTRQAHSTTGWLKVLESNCKGYVFLNIPRLEELDEAEIDCVVPTAKRQRDNGSQPYVEKTLLVEGETFVQSSTHTDVHSSTRMNNCVEKLLGMLFDDLVAHPRPVVRFSYRIIPVEISCNPTKVCILHAVQRVTERLHPPPGRGAVTIIVQLTIKNNTGVEKEKVHLRSCIESSLPVNRFVALPYAKHGIHLDAVLHVFVAHSTCCVGVQCDFSKRKEYNLHNFAINTLHLSDSVTKVERE